MPNPRRSEARKRLAGTDRIDRRPRVDYARRLTEPPPPPETLTPEARPIWDRLAAATTGIGTLTLADLPLLELLAEALAAEAAARATLASEGVTIAAGSGGRKKHPAAAIAETARAQALAMMREFGLSPRARQSVDTAPLHSGGGFDEFDSWLASDPDRCGSFSDSLDAYLATKPRIRQQ